MLPLLVALAVAVLVAQLVQIALLVVLLRRGSLPPSITEDRLARLFDRFVDNTTLIVSGLQEDIEALRQELRASPDARLDPHSGDWRRLWRVVGQLRIGYALVAVSLIVLIGLVGVLLAEVQPAILGAF